VRKVFLHCSASDNPLHDDVSVIRQWHLDKGWADVGYHYFITKGGVIQPGRPLEEVPAAQQGYNTNTLAICLHGLEADKFTEAQFIALRQLCSAIKSQYDHITFHGHCEVSTKACPVFNYKEVLKLDAQGRMQ
jgi:hypothetical protein